MDADDPRHGTEYGYALHLRSPDSPACEPCRAAKRLANRRRRKLNTAGKYGRQRIGESILNRLHQARANGVLYSEICAASGISETTLTRIMAGNSPDTIVATREGVSRRGCLPNEDHATRIHPPTPRPRTPGLLGR